MRIAAHGISTLGIDTENVIIIAMFNAARRSRSSEALVQLLPIILCTFLILSCGCAVTRMRSPEPLRILSYNIHHGEGSDAKLDLERLAKIIRSVQPDLVALQEVDFKTRRTQLIDQPSEFGRLTVGDLNAIPDSDPMRTLFPSWQDAAAQNPQPTVPAGQPRSRIDYILLCSRQSWRILEVRVLDQPVASDHRPIFAVVEWLALQR